MLKAGSSKGAGDGSSASSVRSPSLGWFLARLYPYYRPERAAIVAAFAMLAAVHAVETTIPMFLQRAVDRIASGDMRVGLPVAAILGLGAVRFVLLRFGRRQNALVSIAVSSALRHTRAAELVRALPFIDALPRGFDTWLDESGQNLSHGQRQLLAFARALALEPEILILDEATASVDPETEAEIQAAISRAIRDRTAIVVAHRLQTVRAAHQIAVIEQGRLVELGDHAALMHARGLYHRFYHQQSRAVITGHLDASTAAV